MHFGHLWPRRHTLRVATRLDMSFMLVYMFSSNLLHYYSNMERAFFSPNKHGWCKGEAGGMSHTRRSADRPHPQVAIAITVADADRR